MTSFLMPTGGAVGVGSVADDGVIFLGLVGVVVGAHAAAHGWAPPLGWDHIDTDSEPAQPATTNPGEMDEIAIERAVAGDGIALADLTTAEQLEVVRRLTERGQLHARPTKTGSGQY